MSADEGFLQAIREAPEDDTPRLVYADWLEEHGEGADRDRAEFIRAQCELAELDEGDARREKLTRRADELLRRHRQAWLGRLPQLEGVTWTFARGFAGVAHVRSYRTYQLHERELFRVAPVQMLAFVSMRVPVKLAASAGLARLSALVLRGLNLGDEGVAALAASPHLANLTELDLAANRVGDEGAAALAASPHLPRLKVLRLGGTYSGNRVVSRLRVDRRPISCD